MKNIRTVESCASVGTVSFIKPNPKNKSANPIKAVPHDRDSVFRIKTRGAAIAKITSA